MFIKVFNEKKTRNDHGAYTLNPDIIGENDSGWTVTGDVHEDYYEWVNEFEATHSEYGKVWGDFEYTVYADSQAGYEDFFKNHTPEEWDYYDI